METTELKSKPKRTKSVKSEESKPNIANSLFSGLGFAVMDTSGLILLSLMASNVFQISFFKTMIVFLLISAIMNIGFDEPSIFMRFFHYLCENAKI